ncbi:MAG: hypothetical protein JWN48_806 [Myxococcaceae bacterium]|nr:hypothetical protein [Myxococcaceae bacterium]
MPLIACLRASLLALVSAATLVACAEPLYRMPGDVDAGALLDGQASLMPGSRTDASDLALSPSWPDDSCDPSGAHLFQLDAVATWDPTSQSLLGLPVETVMAGQGFVRIVGLSHIQRDENGWSGSIQPCWGEVPDFTAFNLKFGALISNETWDRIDRTWSTRLSAPCTRPNCAIESNPLTAQLGLDIPESADWPARKSRLDAGIQVDDDGDGVPGVLVSLRSPSEPGGYHYVTGPNLDDISQFEVALRISADLLGTIKTCDVFSGDARKPALSMTVLGCRIKDGGRWCDQGEIDYCNGNLPQWRLTKATWQSQRLPDDASCADVRAKLSH